MKFKEYLEEFMHRDSAMGRFCAFAVSNCPDFEDRESYRDWFAMRKKKTPFRVMWLMYRMEWPMKRPSKTSQH